MAPKSTPPPETDSIASKVASDMATLQDHGFKTMSSMGIAWVEALSDMGSEVMSFVADRIKEDVKTQHKMLHCKDLGELQHIQAQFIQTAIDQYTAETGKLVQMSQELYAPPKAEEDRND